MREPMPHKPRRPVPPRRVRTFLLTLGRTVLLIIGSVALAGAAIWLFNRVEARAVEQQKEVKKKADDAEKAKLRDAVDAWAMHEAMRQYAASLAPKDGDAPPKVAELEVIKEKAYTHFGVKKEESTPNQAPPKRAFAKETKSRAFLDSLTEKAAVASTIAAVLLFLAAILFPLYSFCTSQAASLVSRMTDVSTGRADGASPVTSGVAAIASAIAVGNDGTFARRLALGAAALGTAAVVVGTMTLRVPGSEYDLPVDAPNGRAAINVDTMKLRVQPGEINIPASNITAFGPEIEANVSPLQFNFPALTAQQDVLRALTSELTAYRQLVERQTNRDAEVIRLNAEVIRLNTEKNALDTQNVRLQTTVESEQRQRVLLQEQIEDRNTLMASVKNSIGELTESQKKLVAGQENLSLGSTLEAFRYAQTLNAQNDRLFNQLFRRGVIRQNCDTYARITKTFATLDGVDCIDHGWKHAFWDVPREKSRDIWKYVTRNTTLKPKPVDPKPLEPRKISETLQGERLVAPGSR